MWFIAGSRLSDGAIMYSGVWDTLSPLSSGVYWIIYSLFGESYWTIQILSVLLVFIQSVIFNTTLINKNAFNENTYIPSVVYIILASLYFDFFSLSPVLLGLTFILLAMNNIFGQIEVRAKRDEKLLSTGLYFGIATLFHFPFFIFGLTVIVVFVLFTATIRRRYFLYLFGWILPLILTALYYYYNNSLGLFWQNHIMSWFRIETKIFIPNSLALMIIGFVGFFLILSILRIIRRARLTNYQGRLTQAVFLILILSGTLLFLEVDRNAYIFLAFVPSSAFFISHFFTLTKKGFLGEMIFMFFLIATVIFNYKSMVDADEEGQFNVSSYFVKEDLRYKEFENKRICWLGDNILVYQNASAGTPFINWRLSEEIWEKSKKFENLTIIASSIEEDRPEVIVDPEGLLTKFFERAPKIREKYTREGEIYYLKPSN
jgi:hypothetical protein